MPPVRARRGLVPEQFLSVREVSERLAVRPAVVLTHVASGELLAANVSTSATRPHWRISEHDLARFIEQRTYKAVPPRRRRRAKPANVNKHF
ncbi:helix-turn-helix domain-containing protein [Caulifigura coniformis]|uniref:helix-turn-helix domain-containing protein n=1 Tax=Caulifigura coniformis TaxID=2527983 RepID=UPI0036F27FDE